MHFSLRAVAVVAAVTAFAVHAEAQQPFAKDISLKNYAQNVDGAPSMALDASGVLYVASGYDANGPGNPTDIHRILVGGTVETFTAPIVDPDVLALDGADLVYVGSFGGKITRIDPSDGSQIEWVKASKLGNIDGLAFDLGGDLLVSAIDKQKIHKVDFITQAVTEFADLSALALSGFGSIAVNPSNGDVFVASPLDGDLVRLDSNGNLLDAAFASGFSHMGQLAIDETAIYVSDNTAGSIFQVDLLSRASSLFVHQIAPLAGALVYAGGGRFFASRQTQSTADSDVYEICPMTSTLNGTARIAQYAELELESFADANRALLLFISLADNEITLPNGRKVCLDPAFFLMFQGLMNPAGTFTLPMNIPNNPKLIGLTLYISWVTVEPGLGFFGIASPAEITIQP